MTQKDAVLNWLKREPITPQQALAHIGCFRLAARINDLKNDGHQINAEMIETPAGKHVARYSLNQYPC